MIKQIYNKSNYETYWNKKIYEIGYDFISGKVVIIGIDTNLGTGKKYDGGSNIKIAKEIHEKN